MSDKPIIFNAPMVRALLAGTKTQTRRALKPQPRGTPWFWEGDEVDPDPQWFDGWEEGSDAYGFPEREVNQPLKGVRFSVGDRLWCRETWGGYRGAPNAEEFAGGVPVFYRAAPEDAVAGIDVWRPSIHMPRWASRLTLYVTDVRVQQLQDISEDDARAEGVRGNAGGSWGCEGLIEDYSDLWDAINGPGAWDQNPWVACYTFVPRLGNIDSLPAMLSHEIAAAEEPHNDHD